MPSILGRHWPIPPRDPCLSRYSIHWLDCLASPCWSTLNESTHVVPMTVTESVLPFFQIKNFFYKNSNSNPHPRQQQQQQQHHRHQHRGGGHRGNFEHKMSGFSRRREEEYKMSDNFQVQFLSVQLKNKGWWDDTSSFHQPSFRQPSIGQLNNKASIQLVNLLISQPVDWST